MQTHTPRAARTGPRTRRQPRRHPSRHLGRRRTQGEIGFSTSGHTGIDINVYAHGDPTTVHKLVGNQDNTNIGTIIQEFPRLDLDAVTRDLNK